MASISVGDAPGRSREVRAVLLDMDGTLVDSDAAVERAWRAWCREYGAAESVVLPIAHGQPAATTVASVLPGLDPPAVEKAAARQLALQYDDLADVVALPGAHPLLATLGRLGLPWAVVTSADATLARARLDAAQIAPPLLVTVEDVAHGKPAPDGYLLAARTLGVSPQHCLVVEDSAAGLASGRAAGAATAALRGLAGDLRLTSLDQLATLLDGPCAQPLAQPPEPPAGDGPSRSEDRSTATT